ncbi:4'-phosphopantetheinyl transferase family protein [Enhygromyxa salina]|uniref:4'-phosphopantetheinyl transferase psf-1 n=1 Tax=Enhygromyxa salina TaxID=215803 RepID=A0A2S9YN10_9BACT|nr:4'-phosphopantetheinyl transferase superfamily protein [Enhygromyxa salina]PRQ06470.1 4'-phosphopantetheinyl transferase psf-1 [Enhygromyxa salina]
MSTPGSHRVVVRHINLDRVDIDAVLAQPALSEDERARVDCFRHPDSRRGYVGVRLLVRWLLSQLSGQLGGVDVALGAWRYALNPWGKPAVAWPKLEVPLHFNLSKTRGRAVIAASAGFELGCDIEAPDPRGDELALAGRYFHPEEFRWLAEQPAAARAHAFTRLWTLKEAYAKARGRGLSLGLDRICVGASETPVRVREAGFDSSGWRYCERELAGCQFALACPGPATVDWAELDPGTLLELSASPSR